jgi:hypothetical protein
MSTFLLILGNLILSYISINFFFNIIKPFKEKYFTIEVIADLKMNTGTKERYILLTGPLLAAMGQTAFLLLFVSAVINSTIVAIDAILVIFLLLLSTLFYKQLIKNLAESYLFYKGLSLYGETFRARIIKAGYQISYFDNLDSPVLNNNFFSSIINYKQISKDNLKDSLTLLELSNFNDILADETLPELITQIDISKSNFIELLSNSLDKFPDVSTKKIKQRAITLSEQKRAIEEYVKRYDK